jgi:hypothetical protein
MNRHYQQVFFREACAPGCFSGAMKAENIITGTRPPVHDSSAISAE